MAIAVACYPVRERTPPQFLNRKEIWIYNGNTTGDGTGGNIDFSLYLPTDIQLNKDYPQGIYFYVEQLFFGSNIAASQYLNVITSCLADHEVTGVSGSGQLKGFYINATVDAMPWIQHPEIATPWYLGKRRVWNTNTATILFRTANTNGKKFDLTCYFSTWDGMPKDVFSHGK